MTVFAALVVEVLDDFIIPFDDVGKVNIVLSPIPESLRSRGSILDDRDRFQSLVPTIRHKKRTDIFCKIIFRCLESFPITNYYNKLRLNVTR